MGNFKITQTQTNLRFDTVYNSLLSLDYLKNNLIERTLWYHFNSFFVSY